MMSFTYRSRTVRLIPNVYEPAEDSELMVDALLGTIQEGERVLEIGCGSGIVSVFAMEHSQQVVGVDLNPHAVQCARMNGVDVIRTDLFAGIKGTFDLIMFNPPYLPTSADEVLGGLDDLMVSGGHDGRKTIERFLACLGEHLSPNGRVLLLVSSLTGIEEVCSMMQRAGLDVEPVVRSRHFFEELVVLKGWHPTR